METSSLTSIPTSSPLSFHSTKDVSSAFNGPNRADAALRSYREVKRLSYELREHCMIYFEEGLCMLVLPKPLPRNLTVSDIPAINFLISLLTAGNTLNSPTPAFLPPAQHLALAATLVVHPNLTTRAKSQDHSEAANLALRYLRLVVQLVGPVNGDLQDAFAFSGVGTSSRRGGSGRRRTGEDVSPTNDTLNSINSELATTGALWSRVEDFWQVVGWAFNCSILHKNRWERWSLWLEYMIEVLEKDWDIRGEEIGNSDMDKDDDQNPREQSMIVMYLSSEGATTNREKKILRAVFADASPRTLAEFPEVWRNETKELKKDGAVKKREARIDIEEDNYGDYIEEDEDSDLEDNLNSPPTPSFLTLVNSTSTTNVANPLGGMDAIILRLRLLSLLSTVSAILPHVFTHLVTLYDIYLEHIRPLPLPTFFLIMSPSSLSLFTPAAASSLTQFILRSIIASSAPLPPKDDLEQDILERSYLPYAANTGSISDNAKVSICVETLLRLLDKHIGLVWSEELQSAMEAGIEAREIKAKKGAKKKQDVEINRMWLRASAERIRGVVEMARP